MNLDDLNNLDFNNMGSWPLAARIGLIVIICSGVLGAGYWFDTQYRIEAWDKAQKTEVAKKTEFQEVRKKASSLDILRKQMKDLHESFKIMLKQLPRKAEVDALLVDISQTGIAAGLQFDLFKPGIPSTEEFQSLPIQIIVTGSYHQFGQFVSGIAALPRIVTLHDVALKVTTNKQEQKTDVRMDVSKQDKVIKLSMDAVAKIYNYRDEETTK